MNEEKNKGIVQSIISIILLVGFLIIICLLFILNIPESNKTVVYTMMGSYATASLTCISYWFGSTFSSTTKDKMIYESTPIKSS